MKRRSCGGPSTSSDLVLHRAAVAGERLLELRLVVDEGRQRVVDPSGERGDDRLLDLLEAVLEEERAERGLEQRREDVAVADEPVELVLGQLVRAALLQPPAEVELARDDGAALARDDVRADLREPSLGEVRMRVVERARDRELEDAVAEELEPLVRERPVGRPRRVREDARRRAASAARRSGARAARTSPLRAAATGAR